ncbi:MAG: Trk family potassium uptake protein [Bacilli bacterium]|nr:Trk family potassium uptake protein [Bacilli bacterium]
MSKKDIKIKKNMSPVKVLSLGYLITIAIGTILLLMPFASNTGKTTFIEAIFTATSAVCVTGLTVVNTLEHFTLFGKIVIISLIQIGGLGFMTIVTLLFMMIGKKISIYNQTIMIQSSGSYTISEVKKLIIIIVVGTVLFEGIGAYLIYLIISPTYGDKAIFYGIFHSISAFCNAGFDVFGDSLAPMNTNHWLLIVIMALIVIGGSGFILWNDLIDSKFKFKRLKLHSKIVLVFNLIIIVVPALLFLLFEFTKIGTSGHFIDMNIKDKIVNAFFLSVTPRTAGFYSLDVNELTSSGKILTVILMAIGGNSGSTAGGLKVTTFVVVIANLVSQMRGQKDVVLFKKQISNSVIRQSSALLISFIILILFASLLITTFDNFSFEQIIFEVVSAVCTVGLTSGVSAAGNLFTKIILILLMYAGRLGTLTLLSVFVKEKKATALQEPIGKIIVG